MSHFYTITGEPRYEVQCKTKKGMRPCNIKDALENGWLPGVTTITGILDKPALTKWKVRQAVHAVVTAPDVVGEVVDDKIVRILETEGQADEEAKIARDKGTAVHEAIELAIQGKPFDPQLGVYVNAVFPVIESLGKVVWSERIIVGEGYSGRSDIGIENDSTLFIGDFKTAKSMPKKEPWIEAKLQTAAYAKGYGATGDKHIVTAVIYISTVLPGEVKLFLNENWQETYEHGFKPLLEYWRWANNMTGGSL